MDEFGAVYGIFLGTAAHDLRVLPMLLQVLLRQADLFFAGDGKIGKQLQARISKIEVALEFVEAALEVSPNNADWQGVAQRLRDMTGTLDL